MADTDHTEPAPEGVLESVLETTPDGALTNEVGVISGRLALRTGLAADGALTLGITYEGATEWYTLAGEGYRLHDARDHEVVHRLLVNVLQRPSAP